MKFPDLARRLFAKYKGIAMTLDEQIAADQAALMAALAAVDVANAKLAASQSTKTALDALESAANALTNEGVKANALALVTAGRNNNQ